MKLIFNRRLHWAARSEALLTLMLFPLSKKHFERLRKLYDQEPSSSIKKAVLVVFLKAPDTLKKKTYQTTILEPGEEINRFRKYLWALANSPAHCQPTLKKIAQLERDPARLLVPVRGALQARHVDTLKQVRAIAQNTLKSASPMMEKELSDICASCKAMVQDLINRK